MQEDVPDAGRVLHQAVLAKRALGLVRPGPE